MNDRALGYRVDARDLYLGQSGRVLAPYPINRNGLPERTFTWRDTAVLAKDGLDSPGIPLLIETSAPLGLVPGPAGRIALPGNVPAWGLPLLIEVRCFPTSSALGLNPLEIYLAQNAQQLPCFRAYSTGGINAFGVTVTVDPDLAMVPEGGFNPRSRPPGSPTTFEADNSFYTGELDTIERVSRAHSVWIHAEIDSPHYLPPILVPRPEQQPAAARIEVEFRGATGFSAQGLVDSGDARNLDPMGDLGDFDVQFLGGDRRWFAAPAAIDGANYFQLRISFVNDLFARAVPELSALGVAYEAR
jgi:hypothetical protein